MQLLLNNLFWGNLFHWYYSDFTVIIIFQSFGIGGVQKQSRSLLFVFLFTTFHQELSFFFSCICSSLFMLGSVLWRQLVTYLNPCGNPSHKNVHTHYFLTLISSREVEPRFYFSIPSLLVSYSNSTQLQNFTISIWKVNTHLRIHSFICWMIAVTHSSIHTKKSSSHSPFHSLTYSVTYVGVC